jgi:hypothetical protein
MARLMDKNEWDWLATWPGEVTTTIGLINREYGMSEPFSKWVEVLPPFATDKDPWIPAKVRDRLASQFTADVEQGHGTQFYFYMDKGRTWRDARTEEVPDGQ